MGTNATIALAAIGVFYLIISSEKTIILEDCLFVSQIRRSLISISKLGSFGYSFLFNFKLSIRLNNKFVAFGMLYDGLYVLDYLKEDINCVEINKPCEIK